MSDQSQDGSPPQPTNLPPGHQFVRVRHQCGADITEHCLVMDIPVPVGLKLDQFERPTTEFVFETRSVQIYPMACPACHVPTITSRQQSPILVARSMPLS